MGRRDWWKRWVEEVEEKGVFDALKCIALVERGTGGPTDRITLGLLSAPTTRVVHERRVRSSGQIFTPPSSLTKGSGLSYYYQVEQIVVFPEN